MKSSEGYCHAPVSPGMSGFNKWSTLQFEYCRQWFSLSGCGMFCSKLDISLPPESEI